MYCSLECKRKGAARRLQTPDGGRYVTPQGYVMVRVGHGRGAEHRAEHRIVVERAIGRRLSSDEHVHHINGNRQDNRLENLEVLSNAEHQRVHDHAAKWRKPKVACKCQQCGAVYWRKPSRAAITKYCSRSCRSRAVSTARWAKVRSG